MIKTLKYRRTWAGTRTKCFNVVFERSLMLEVRTAHKASAFHNSSRGFASHLSQPRASHTCDMQRALFRASSCNGFARFGNLLEALLSGGLCCSCTLQHNNNMGCGWLPFSESAPLRFCDPCPHRCIYHENLYYFYKKNLKSVTSFMGLMGFKPQHPSTTRGTWITD